MKLPALKVHLVPTQAVLLAHAHPSVDLEQKMGQELSEAAFAGSA
jgi:metallophosphoesterase superfamily enzyme